MADKHVESGWFQTFTGLKVPMFDPKPEHINIADIAHGLAYQCRFRGQTATFYSVAQHSVYVARHCEHPLVGLLHDAAEYITGDWPRPQKHAMPAALQKWYKEWTRKVDAAIAEALDCPELLNEPADVKAADMVLLATEARDFMSPLHPDWEYCEEKGYPVLAERLESWEPRRAERVFMEAFWSLAEQKHGGRAAFAVPESW